MPLFNDNKPQTVQEPEVDTPVVDEAPAPIEPEVNTNIPDVSFIVEDGSIVPLANSYTTLDYADEYCANKGYEDWLQLDDKLKKVLIIRGTEFVNNFYDWKGKRKAQLQSLAFPRMEITDNDGYPVLGVPENLKKACLEAAYLITTSEAETLFSTKDENGKIKRQKVDELEVEYFDNEKSSKIKTLTGLDFTSIYDILNYMLKGLYKTEKDEYTNAVCAKAIWSR